VSAASRPPPPGLQLGVQDEAALDGLNIGDSPEIAGHLAPFVRGRGHLAGHLIAVTDLGLGQFGRLDRFRRRHGSAFTS
jgi:hypothetical protein